MLVLVLDLKMKPARVHSWNVSPDEATAIQMNLRPKVEVCDYERPVKLIGATAVAFDLSNDLVHAVVVTMQYPEMSIVEQFGITQEIRFPYMSGLLAFREGGPLIQCFHKIEKVPDVILFHAHGKAHPREFGLASHMGVLLDTPSIGISTKLLVGHHKELSMEEGSQTSIIYQERSVGTALRTKEGVKPIYISVGHKIDLTSSVKIVKDCITHYQSPEPLRLAQLAVAKQKSGQTINSEQISVQTTLF